ncbi:hypothetical protein A0H81_08751 [Grifola frondosa]|uniref:AB hydrolase-1 domain-containing protein n=1 Tax=Grifola frondosa TaxID=5627 RepID=A0A1C7M430_GRIFR|nr:hypothetical protein A0H81_08751 [Grifola frondosa]
MAVLSRTRTQECPTVLSSSSSFTEHSVSGLPRAFQVCCRRREYITSHRRSRLGKFVAPAKPFTACLLEDITALLSHLHPDTTDLKIIVSGGSYGTAPAQMIFGAPFDIFPYGRHIIALRLLKFILQWKLRTVDRAEAFLRSLMFDKMDTKEREAFAEWRSRSGIAEGQFEREMAEGMVRSVSKTWEGPFAIADVLHSDWGFSPATLDEAHAKPVLIAVSDADRIGKTYPKACIKRYEGGHLAAAWKSDDLWAEALAFV